MHGACFEVFSHLRGCHGQYKECQIWVQNPRHIIQAKVLILNDVAHDIEVCNHNKSSAHGYFFSDERCVLLADNFCVVLNQQVAHLAATPNAIDRSIDRSIMGESTVAAYMIVNIFEQHTRASNLCVSWCSSIFTIFFQISVNYKKFCLFSHGCSSSM